MIIDRSRTHEVLAQQDHDDLARAQFIVGLKRQLRQMSQGNAHIYNKIVAPDFVAEHDRMPATIDEIRPSMERQPFYQIWSALTRTAQDLMWEAVGTSIDHSMAEMRAAAERLSRSGNPMGSLTLDPHMKPAPDVLLADIHCQPGGYMRDRGPDDITAGAFYESGGNMYSLGAGIGARDSKSAAVIGFLAERFPHFKPQRILDIGCSAGGASVGYAAHFPDAEVHAVDVGPAMLRYAHARAESLGVAVHFHQMNATSLSFPDDEFDLVVSHNVMHEVSCGSLADIFAESRRVLKPGGIALHQDVPIKGERSLFERFMFNWESTNNNEPFWEVFAEADVGAMMEAAGFSPAATEQALIPKLDGPGAWYAVFASK
jgi:SAM-dependent methyltransferase